MDELTRLGEEELDQFLLTEEEVRFKERVWVEMIGAGERVDHRIPSGGELRVQGN